MKWTLLLVVGLMVLGSGVWADTALTAGTAPGNLHPGISQHTISLHYPPGAKTPRFYQLDGSHPNPDNGTFPYNEWKDMHRVTGHRPAMIQQYVIMGSHRRK
jgi:hypothetical protein